MSLPPSGIPMIAAAPLWAAGPRGSVFSGPGDIDSQGPALEFFAMEHFDGFRGLLRCGHFDERKSSRFSCKFVEHHVHRPDDARLGEVILQVTRHRLIREVANEKSCEVHLDSLIGAEKTQWGDTAPAAITESQPEFDA